MCGDQEEGPKGTIVVEGTSESNDRAGKIREEVRGSKQV